MYFDQSYLREYEGSTSLRRWVMEVYMAPQSFALYAAICHQAQEEVLGGVQCLADRQWVDNASHWYREGTTEQVNPYFEELLNIAAVEVVGRIDGKMVLEVMNYPPHIEARMKREQRQQQQQVNRQRAAARKRDQVRAKKNQVPKQEASAR